MINVGIVSEKENVAFHMASVVCKAGAHAERFNEYIFEKIKSFNIVIIDLDNASASYDNIKKTSAGINDIIVVGFSRNNDLLDEYRPIISVFMKPFKTDHFLSFVEDLKHLTKTENVVNNEEKPIYNKTGMNLNANNEISTEIFSDKEMSQKLAKLINEKYNGPSEEEYLASINLDKVVIEKKQSEPVEIATTIAIIDYSQQFVDDALYKYREQKLKERKMSTREIIQTVRMLLIEDANRAKNEFVSVDKVLKKFDEKNNIKDDMINIEKKSFEEKEITSETIVTIEDQRKEAIYSDIDDSKINHNTSLNDNYTDTELKYIKHNSKATVVDEIVEEKKKEPTNSLSLQQRNGIIIEKSELTKKAQRSMTKEQIERLRKLGVKI